MRWLAVLGVNAHIEATIDISFGLEFCLSVVAEIFNTLEVNMNGSISLVSSCMVSVWCGVAFLRRPVGKAPAQMRDRYASTYVASKREREGLDSLPPHLLSVDGFPHDHPPQARRS